MAEESVWSRRNEFVSWTNRDFKREESSQSPVAPQTNTGTKYYQRQSGNEMRIERSVYRKVWTDIGV